MESMLQTLTQKLASIKISIVRHTICTRVAAVCSGGSFLQQVHSIPATNCYLQGRNSAGLPSVPHALLQARHTPGQQIHPETVAGLGRWPLVDQAPGEHTEENPIWIDDNDALWIKNHGLLWDPNPWSILAFYNLRLPVSPLVSCLKS